MRQRDPGARIGAVVRNILAQERHRLLRLVAVHHREFVKGGHDARLEERIGNSVRLATSTHHEARGGQLAQNRQQLGAVVRCTLGVHGLNGSLQLVEAVAAQGSAICGPDQHLEDSTRDDRMARICNLAGHVRLEDPGGLALLLVLFERRGLALLQARRHDLQQSWTYDAVIREIPNQLSDEAGLERGLAALHRLAEHSGCVLRRQVTQLVGACAGMPFEDQRLKRQESAEEIVSDDEKKPDVQRCVVDTLPEPGHERIVYLRLASPEQEGIELVIHQHDGLARALRERAQERCQVSPGEIGCNRSVLPASKLTENRLACHGHRI